MLGQKCTFHINFDQCYKQTVFSVIDRGRETRTEGKSSRFCVFAMRYLTDKRKKKNV